MKFVGTALAGLMEVHTTPHVDARGRFTRLHCEQELATVAPGARVVQINHSVSLERGTLRGLHFQQEAAAEGKVVRCLRGKVFDVAVDVRPHSSTFGRWHAVELSEHGGVHMWLPPGFAHGFQTLTDDVELLYFHTAPYSVALERGVRFNDPCLAIPWPMAPTQMSARDQALPAWMDVFQGEPV